LPLQNKSTRILMQTLIWRPASPSSAISAYPWHWRTTGGRHRYLRQSTLISAKEIDVAVNLFSVIGGKNMKIYSVIMINREFMPLLPKKAKPTGTSPNLIRLPRQKILRLPFSNEPASLCH
jgi:hypothetical protein